MSGWQDIAAPGLENAIAEFKDALPGWWFSVCECQVSADASCAPTVESPHIALCASNARFDSGFHADLPQPATLADALRTVMNEALAALATPPEWPDPAEYDPLSMGPSPADWVASLIDGIDPTDMMAWAPPFSPTTTSHPTPETIDTMAQERLAPLECWIDDLADAGAFGGAR